MRDIKSDLKLIQQKVDLFRMPQKSDYVFFGLRSKRR